MIARREVLGIGPAKLASCARSDGARLGALCHRERRDSCTRSRVR